MRSYWEHAGEHILGTWGTCWEPIGNLMGIIIIQNPNAPSKEKKKLLNQRRAPLDFILQLYHRPLPPEALEWITLEWVFKRIAKDWCI